MKKQLIVFFGLSLIIGKVSAQLTLDHTFAGLMYNSFPYVEEPIGYYYCLDNYTCTLYIYNTNYSLYKTTSLNLPSGCYNITASNLGKHLINTDDKAEFTINATYVNPSSYYITMIINEDGEIIHNFGQSDVITYSGVYKVGNQLRLNFSKGEYHLQNNISYIDYQTEVYICHGNYNAVVSFENENTTMRPYPNPTTTLINLPYHIEKGTVSTINIYNINGQLVDSYKIGGDFEMITIDVNNYAKGIYVYEYNDISNRFVVQ